MSGLDRRKEGMEAKLKIDSELRFKVEMRRDRALGQWAAEQMGLVGADADEYVKAVIHSDFEEVGSDDVIRKIVADFEAKGFGIDAAAVRAELDRFEKAARDELIK